MRKVIIGLILLICGILSGCQSETTMTVPELLEPVGVKSDMVTAQVGDIQQMFVYNAEVVPYVEKLHFITDGQFDKYTVSVGDEVQEGQVLAMLDDEAARDAIEALETTIREIKRSGEFQDRQAKADIEIAKATLAMMQEAGSSSEDCEIQKKTIAILQTRLNQAQQLRDLELQRNNAQLQKLYAEIGKKEITAPFSGKVVYLQTLEKGDGVRGFTPVICIADESQIWISAEFIEPFEMNSADGIYAGISGQMYPVTYFPYEYDDYLAMVNAGETVDTRFTFDQLPETLECGEYAQIILVEEYKENVLVVPVNALYKDEQGYYVYTQQEDKRVRCDVEVGFISDTEAEILSGIQEGDTVYVKE